MLPRSIKIRVLQIFGTSLFIVSIASGLLSWRTRPAHAADDPSSVRAMYSREVAGQYSYQFGPDQPFLPSNATTDTGQFINSKSFLTAEYCGRCHREAYAEWRQSAHANAFRAPWYIKNTNMLKDGKGIAYTRDRKSTRLNSSHPSISYAVFCL